MRGHLALLLGLSLLAGGCPKSPAKTASLGPRGAAAGSAPVASEASVAQAPVTLAQTATPTPSALAVPSASPASGASALSDRDLAGLWWGRRISLELTKKGSGYAGRLALRGREYSVEVRRGPAGWGGVLVQGAQKAEFSVVREQGGLVLAADGRSYTLERVEVGVSVVGTYRGPRGTTLKLDFGTEGYTGSLGLDGVEYVLRGQEAEGGYVGSLRDPLTGKELTWSASKVSEDSLLFTIRLEDREGKGRASFHALRFERAE